MNWVIRIVVLTWLCVAHAVAGTISIPFPGPGAASGAASKTVNYLGNAIDASTRTTYNFTSQPFGTASSDRLIIVGIWGGATGTVSISSVTIGGVSASQIGSAISQTASAGSTFLYGAFVPTGTTGTVSVTFNIASSLGSGIGIWNITGLASATPNASGGGAANNSGSIATLASGVLICFGGASQSVAYAGGVTTSGTGITQRFSTAVFATRTIGGGDAATSGSAITCSQSITGGTQGVVAAAW